MRRLNVESLVQFGQGAEQRRICTAETDGTGIIAETIAQDKELTKALLRRVGIPVPDGRPVTSAEDAWTAACEIGVPVVVKPRDANHGRGVAVKLTLRDRIMLAYEHAVDEGSEVIVEQYVPGTEHRILVVGNRVVAVSRGEPDVVVGDGVKSVRELVELANLDPRRGDEFARPMCKLKLDPIALLLLEHQDYVPESIPANGATVIIHRNGEFTTDVTDHLHPEVAARAVLAARTVGLDVAGIDVVVQDIGRPLEEQGGMVIEVNAGPGLQMHAQPQNGRSRPVGAAIIDELFPHGQTGRIPVVAISDGPGALKATRLTSQLLRQSGLSVGMASREGTFVGDRRLAANAGIQPCAADLFLNPLVEAAVLLTTPQVVYQEGLSFDDCDVVVIESTPVQRESCEGLHEPDSWRRILVESVTPLGTAVIDADDPHAQRLASYCRGDVLFCHPGEQHPLLVQHRTAGHSVIFLRDRTIWVAHGEKEFAIATAKTTVDAPMLAGVAAAWATGTPPDILAKAIELLGDVEFVPSLPGTPTDGPLTHPDQPRAA